MGLNNMNAVYEARYLENTLLPKWAEDERLYNCEGNYRSLFRDILLSKLWNIFG